MNIEAACKLSTNDSMSWDLASKTSRHVRTVLSILDLTPAFQPFY